MDVINQISILQHKLYNQCGELYEAKEVLGDVLYNKMLTDYKDAYNSELEVLKKDADIHYKNVKFVQDVKYDTLTPHRCGFLWLKNNEAKKLALRETYVETESAFELREAALEPEEEKLEKKGKKLKKPAPGVLSVPSGGAAPSEPVTEPASAKQPKTAQEPPREIKKRARTADAQIKGQISIENLKSNSDN